MRLKRCFIDRPASASALDWRTALGLLLMAQGLTHASLVTAQDHLPPRVIGLAPAVCLAPMGRSTYPVPYPVVAPHNPQSQKPIGNVVGMDGCGPLGLPALARRNMTPAKQMPLAKKRPIHLKPNKP